MLRLALLVEDQAGLPRVRPRTSRRPMCGECRLLARIGRIATTAWAIDKRWKSDPARAKCRN